MKFETPRTNKLQEVFRRREWFYKSHHSIKAEKLKVNARPCQGAVPARTLWSLLDGIQTRAFEVCKYVYFVLKVFWNNRKGKSIYVKHLRTTDPLINIIKKNKIMFKVAKNKGGNLAVKIHYLTCSTV